MHLPETTLFSLPAGAFCYVICVFSMCQTAWSNALHVPFSFKKRVFRTQDGKMRFLSSFKA